MVTMTSDRLEPDLRARYALRILPSFMCGSQPGDIQLYRSITLLVVVVTPFRRNDVDIVNSRSLFALLTAAALIY